MRTLLAVSLAALWLPLAACGGDSDSGSGSSTSKDAFIAKGDAICERVNAQIAELNDKLGAVATAGGSVAKQFEATEPLLRESVAIQEDAIEEFRALEPPEEDADQIDAYLDKAEEQRDGLEEMVEAAKNRDRKAMEEASAKISPIGAQRRTLAQNYGFEKCGGG